LRRRREEAKVFDKKVNYSRQDLKRINQEQRERDCGYTTDSQENII
jgi:hypothetical protein